MHAVRQAVACLAGAVCLLGAVSNTVRAGGCGSHDRPTLGLAIVTDDWRDLPVFGTTTDQAERQPSTRSDCGDDPVGSLARGVTLAQPALARLAFDAPPRDEARAAPFAQSTLLWTSPPNSRLERPPRGNVPTLTFFA